MFPLWKDTTALAVCFVPYREAEFESYENNEGPVKINYFSLSRRHGSDIVIDKRSTVDIVSDIDFKPNVFNNQSSQKS